MTGPRGRRIAWSFATVMLVSCAGTATVTVPELLAALASDGGRPQR